MTSDETAKEVVEGVIDGLNTEGHLTDSEADEWFQRIESADGGLSIFLILDELHEEYEDEIQQIIDRSD